MWAPKSLNKSRRNRLAATLTIAACCGFGMRSPAAGQSSMEQIPASGSDVATELGLLITKFKVRYNEPVYCLVRLQMQSTHAPPVDIATSSKEARRTTEILFSIKDVGFIRRQLGLGQKDADIPSIPVSFHARSETFSLKHYAESPFGTPVPGQSYITWTPRHSTEDLPLDKELSLFVKAGPYAGDDAGKVRDVLQEYVLAPAFIRLTVRFSKMPLKTKAQRAEESRKEHIEQVLADFDAIVKRVTGFDDPDTEAATVDDENAAAPEE